MNTPFSSIPESALPEPIRKAIQDARAAILARGAMLQMRLGPGAFGLYKARVDGSELIPTIGALVADDLTASRHSAMMGLLDSWHKTMCGYIVAAGVLSESAVAEVEKEVVEAQADADRAKERIAAYIATSLRRGPGEG